MSFVNGELKIIWGHLLVGENVKARIAKKTFGPHFTLRPKGQKKFRPPTLKISMDPPL